MTDDKTVLTIIVPVLNEAKAIGPFLDALSKAIERAEDPIDVVFVDGGSRDSTDTLIRDFGFPVVQSDRGRGNQIAAGMTHAKGRWILTLHADALISVDGLVDLIARLDKDPAVTWGILGHRYDVGGIGFRLTAWLNTLRFRFLGLAYGDQGIFFKRAIVDDLGGFPAQALMEDIELSHMLAHHPRMRLGRYLTVSTRRWQRQGFWSYSIGNLRMARQYIKNRRTGRSADDLANAAYNAYYGDDADGKSDGST